jgi:hypothetical protein
LIVKKVGGGEKVEIKVIWKGWVYV